MKKDIPTKSTLSWKKADFIKNNAEIPDCLLNDDTHSEGEMMSENEIIEWILETQKTFQVIKDSNKELFDKLYKEYLVDLDYLIALGKIDKESLDYILDPENFEI